MKNLLCILFITCNLTLLFSQDTLKHQVQSVAAELNFNPFDGGLSFNNSLNQVKIRYFSKQNLAHRLSFDLNYYHNKEKESQIYGYNPYESEKKMNSYKINLGYGIEIHRKGTKRLSPYYGAELTFGYQFSKYTYNDDDKTNEIKGELPLSRLNTTSYTYYDQSRGQYVTVPLYIFEGSGNTSATNTYKTMDNRPGYFSVGGILFAGFDFYFAKNIYFGYEFSLIADYIKPTNVEKTTSDNNGKYQPYNNTEPETKQSIFIFKPHLLNGVRFGFIF